MDTRTVILLLSLGSFVFCLLLVVFQHGKEARERIPYLASAKFLQGLGSLIMYLRDLAPDFGTVATGNALVLLGCVQEYWAVLYLVGRPASGRRHVLVMALVAAACLATYGLAPPGRAGVLFCLHTLFYLLPAWSLMRPGVAASLLRRFLGVSYLLLGLLFLTHFLLLSLGLEKVSGWFGPAVYAVMQPSIYCIMLIGGVSLLLLAKEKSDHALEASNRKLAALNRTDSLTGIANRRHFDEALAREIARHARSGDELSLILLDIDHFKAFNDLYGHVAGDDCLRRVSGVLSRSVGRAGDFVARYGGEEFVCILPMTDSRGAYDVAEQMRRGVAALGIPHAASDAGGCVTISCGAATCACTDVAKASDIVSRADTLLYQAKAAGRNRTWAERCQRAWDEASGHAAAGRSA
ncbi:MAG: diguanylate cyclase domain-containing protein [Solidesulfovibrio sp. DCME]|uniref:GGDEF domain-containing protein n=1 Tax=Solidesulfovibrio sp. DCME TaxID=3447380 RepID=UPI003D10757D